MFPVGAQNPAGLSFQRVGRAVFRAECNRAGIVQRQTEVHPLPLVAFNLWEESAHCLCVMPVSVQVPGQQPTPSHAQKRPFLCRYQVVVASVEVLANGWLRNRYGNVESYHVSRQSLVCAGKRAKFSATYLATASAESNLAA